MPHRMFEIRSFGKTELAELYHMDWRTIKAIVFEEDEMLFDEINTRKRVLSPRIVRRIVEIMGEP